VLAPGRTIVVTVVPVPIIVVTSVSINRDSSSADYVPQYNDQKFTPADIPSTSPGASASGTFSQARMNPYLLMLEPATICATPSDML